jgi:hypothetical protein
MRMIEVDETRRGGSAINLKPTMLSTATPIFYLAREVPWGSPRCGRALSAKRVTQLQILSSSSTMAYNIIGIETYKRHII